MKWTEDPVKIDAMLSEVHDLMCEHCQELDESAATYCDNCDLLADFRDSLLTNRRLVTRLRLRQGE